MTNRIKVWMEVEYEIDGILDPVSSNFPVPLGTFSIPEDVIEAMKDAMIGEPDHYDEEDFQNIREEWTDLMLADKED